MLLMMTWALAWADSPLTSTHFADVYNDHPMVQMAIEIGECDDPDIPNEMFAFLSNKKEPTDVRLAVVNGISWGIAGGVLSQFEEFLMKRYKVDSPYAFISKLDAGTLIVYAYLKALGDYFDVREALEFAQMAVGKDKKKSFSIAFIASLIHAQFQMDNSWGLVYKVVADVREDTSLVVDMRLKAIDQVMEYINLYKEYYSE